MHSSTRQINQIRGTHWLRKFDDRAAAHNLCLDPSGNWLFAANENGGSIAGFRVDRKTGHLTPTNASARIDTPGGLYFLRR